MSATTGPGHDAEGSRVAVIGAGTMGAGIAQACLAAGRSVALHDADAEAIERGRSRIAAGLAKAAEKGRLGDQDAEAVLARLDPRPGALAGAIRDADVVIEAVFEDRDVKVRAWNAIGEAADAGALLATNTSSLSVTELARASGHPDRFVGLHFFNPVPVLPLVELVRPDGGPSATVDRAARFVESLGKTPVRCADRPGFLVNRLLIPYLNEAAQLADEGVAEPEAIDTAMRLGANVPIGPLALADLIGIDVVLAVMETLFDEFGDPRYRPAQRLRRMVREGRLGRKSGRGFFRYEETA